MIKTIVTTTFIGITSCFTQISTTININGKVFSFSGELVCEMEAEPNNNEEGFEYTMTCYAELNQDTIFYHEAMASSDRYIGYDMYAIALADLNLKHAKAVWETHYFMSYPLVKRLDIPASEMALKINCRNLQYSSQLPMAHERQLFSMHFENKKAADLYLKKMKKARQKK